MSRLTRDGTAEPVSRDQILRHERGQGNINFSCSAYHVQDWQPHPVDPYSCYMCDHTWAKSVEGSWPCSFWLLILHSKVVSILKSLPPTLERRTGDPPEGRDHPAPATPAITDSQYVHEENEGLPGRDSEKRLIDFLFG